MSKFGIIPGHGLEKLSGEFVLSYRSQDLTM